MEYYSQKGSPYADCDLVALANACVFLGVPHPRPGTKAWDELARRACCDTGTAIPGVETLAAWFDLRAARVPTPQIEGVAPLHLTVKSPEVYGHSLHAVLVVGWEGDRATVVNYRVMAGPLVETLPVCDGRPKVHPWEEGYAPWDALYVPPPPNDRAYELTKASS